MVDEINQCVYVHWYKFKQCRIKTCKNYTSITSTHCLTIDRVQPAGVKIITDAELHMYKFPADNISTRLVSLKRKKALTRVKSVLILRQFIAYLYGKYAQEEAKDVHTKYTERAEKAFPLKIQKLGFRRWMWHHLVSAQEYKEFTRGREGECTLFALHDLLHMTDMKFKALCQSLTKE